MFCEGEFGRCPETWRIAMGARSKDLADRIRRFNGEVIAFVEGCGDEDWRKTTAEDWSVGVVARHIGA
jgi:hypothetical protein